VIATSLGFGAFVEVLDNANTRRLFLKIVRIYVCDLQTAKHMSKVD